MFDIFNLKTNDITIEAANALIARMKTLLIYNKETYSRIDAERKALLKAGKDEEAARLLKICKEKANQGALITILWNSAKLLKTSSIEIECMACEYNYIQKKGKEMFDLVQELNTLCPLNDDIDLAYADYVIAETEGGLDKA